VFLALWFANQALWRWMRWHVGKRDTLCVAPALAARPRAACGGACDHACGERPHSLLTRELSRRARRSANTISCGMSLFHGATTAVLSGREARGAAVAPLWPHRSRCRRHALTAPQVLAHYGSPMDGPNSAHQNLIMQLSMARAPRRGVFASGTCSAADAPQPLVCSQRAFCACRGISCWTPSTWQPTAWTRSSSSTTRRR
jgi:hypothetical protein